MLTLYDRLSPELKLLVLAIRHLIPLWQSGFEQSFRRYWFHEIPMHWHSRPSVWKQARMVLDVVRFRIDDNRHMRYPESFGLSKILVKALKLGGKIARGE